MTKKLLFATPARGSIDLVSLPYNHDWNQIGKHESLPTGSHGFPWARDGGQERYKLHGGNYNC